MRNFGKVILSRKGFDSSTGGGYSPFDPKTGKYIVLPIPVEDKELNICNPLKYEDIHIRRDYLPGYPQTNLKSLMEVMEKRATIKKKQSEYAHFDPWLGPCPWLAEDSNHKIGVFGQIGAAQAHLHNKGVGEGSLFLFFSRFKPIKNRENIILDNIIGREHIDKDLYFIYGWLKVKEIIREWKAIMDTNLLSLLKGHPHATEKYFEQNNAIYIADEFLFPDDNIPGCGYFPRLNQDLCLSASDSAQEPEKWMPSRWSLPGFFRKKCLSVLKNRGRIHDDDGSWLVHTNWRWQEAVFDFDESEDFRHWFQRLIVDSLPDLTIPKL